MVESDLGRTIDCLYYFHPLVVDLVGSLEFPRPSLDWFVILIGMLLGVVQGSTTVAVLAAHRDLDQKGGY